MNRIDFRKISERDHIPIIRTDTEEFLKTFLSKHKIKRVLEYGTAIGYSSLFFSESGNGLEVFSVEKDEYAVEIAKRNLSLFETSASIRIIRGDAIKLTDRIMSESGGEFDMVFIDGGKSHYLELMREAMSLCRKGGYILSDDIWQRGLTKIDPATVSRKHRTSMRNMQEYLEYITNTPELKTEIKDIGDGLAISRYLGKHE